MCNDTTHSNACQDYVNAFASVFPAKKFLYFYIFLCTISHMFCLKIFFPIYKGQNMGHARYNKKKKE